jgi:protein-S-isoprenylcysteine O-methyltransferase Ste14
VVQLLRRAGDEVAAAAGAAPGGATAAARQPTAWERRVLLPAGHLFFKHRDWIFPAVFLALVAASRPRLPFGSAAWDAGLNALGVAVALAGQMLRAAVIGYAYIRRGGKNRKIHADVLVAEGFFAHCRNPLYAGNLLALTGFTLIHNSPLCYLAGLPFFAFAYLSIVVAEEDHLRRRFGDAYVDYCRRVNRFLPSFAGLGRTLEGMRFDWRRLIRKEYGATFAGLSAVVALVVWDSYRLYGAAEARGTLLAAALVWLPLVAAYGVARSLKKSGALGTGAAETPGSTQ